VKRIVEAVTKAKRPRPRRAPRLRGERPTHSADGVDLTLIRWMLSLTPEERIRALEDNIHALMQMVKGKGRGADRAGPPVLRKTLAEKRR
jgi:hypothetical protein